MFTNNVSNQVEKVHNLEFGQISCMHCPMYFKFEADKSLITQIVQEHALVKVDHLPEDIVNIVRMIDATWWLRGKDFDASEKYFISYDPPKNAGGERRIRIALVKGNAMYFVTNGYYLADRPLKEK